MANGLFQNQSPVVITAFKNVNAYKFHASYQSLHGLNTGDCSPLNLLSCCFKCLTNAVYSFPICLLKTHTC